METPSLSGNGAPVTTGASGLPAISRIQKDRTTGHTFTLNSLGVTPGLDGTLSGVDISRDPISVRVVHDPISVRANLLIWDHDETISEGTGEHFHDGHVARFARGLSSYLVALHNKSSTGILSQAHFESFSQTGSVFSPEEWIVYRGESGKSEDGVLRGMLRIAEERFELTKKGVTPQVAEFSAMVDAVSSEQFKDFMKPVRATEGTREILTEADAHEVKSIVISASKHQYVMMMLEHNELHELVHTVIGNAQKKVNATTFEKKDMEAGCVAAGVLPREAVMFGDSIGDIAAAARAGVGTIIIRTGRPAPFERRPDLSVGAMAVVSAERSRPESPVKAQVDSFQKLEHYREELLSHGYPINVLLVEEFSQVKFEGGVSSGEHAFYYDSVMS